MIMATRKKRKQLKIGGIFILFLYLFSIFILLFGSLLFAEASYYDNRSEEGSPQISEVYNDGVLQVTSEVNAGVNGQTGDVNFNDKIRIENVTDDQLITFNSITAILNEGFESAVIGNGTVNNTDEEILFNGGAGDSFVPEFDLDSGEVKEFSVSTTLSGLEAGKLVNKKPFRFVYDYEAGTNEAYALLTSNKILMFYYDTNKDKREGKIFSIPEYIDGVDFENEEQPGWSTPAIARNINKIIFDGSFTEKYKPTTMSGGFRYMNNAGLIDISGLDTSQVKSFGCCFNPEYEGSNTKFLFPEILVYKACINMGGMFSYCNIANYYKCISKFDVSSTIYMRGVFQFCSFNQLKHWIYHNGILVV